jgi:superfamily II DNA or RNA helicase
MVADFIKAINAGHDRIALIAGTGAGKAQPLTSKVLTPGGYKLMGELDVGDQVTGKDGGIYRVTSIHPQGEKEVYKVTFTDGSSTFCCDDHLWNVKLRHGGFWQTLPLLTIRKFYNNIDVIIPIVKPVTFNLNLGELPVDPYEFGLSLDNSQSIPDVFKYSTVDNRIKLLRGLFESGAIVKSGHSYEIKYITTSRMLAEDIQFLARSLGGICQIKSFNSDSKFHVNLTLPENIPPFEACEKYSTWLNINTNNVCYDRIVHNIELVGKEFCQCITVDAPDSLYVTDDFIVTHNTVIASKIIQILRHNNLKILFLVHRDVLISQTANKLQSFGLSCGFIKAGYEEDPSNPIQIASIQTLDRRDGWKKLHFDVVIADEGHRTVYTAVHKEMMEDIYRKAIFVTLTATPYRLSSKEKMGDIFPKMIASPVPKKLMEMGYLAPLKYYSIGEADLSKVRTHMGDFREGDLSIVCNTPELIDKIVEEYKKKTPGKTAIGFTVDIKHAEDVCEAFKHSGIPSVVVSGKTPYETRRYFYKCLREGKIKVLLSCDAISEGFDEPSVEVGLLLRPTKSKALYEQQIGRVMRISPDTGKTHGTVLDQAGNVRRHGFIEDREVYRIPKTSDTKSNEDNPVPLKSCPNCGAFLYGFQMECVCGYKFEAKPVAQISGDLVEIVVDKKAHRHMLAFQKLRRNAFDKGHDPYRANYQFKEKYKFEPKNEWCRDSIYGDLSEKPLREKGALMRKYFEYLNGISKTKKKDLRWVGKQMELEFGSNWKNECLSKSDIERWDTIIKEISIAFKNVS